MKHPDFSIIFLAILAIFVLTIQFIDKFVLLGEHMINSLYLFIVAALSPFAGLVYMLFL